MRLVSILALLGLLVAATPIFGQVVETEPAPPRTDQSVTLYFNADEGTGGLEDHNGEVYAHTGISTDQNPDEEWKCVKNHWPTSDQFTGNRDDTKLTQVAGQPNRYRLEIQDIRAYYQNTSTSCLLGEDEKIETMNMVFRNADGSKEGKGEGGSDIFVDVVDVSGQEPIVETTITEPTGNPPLYPFMTATDTTVTVSVSADTANVDALTEVRLFVDGSEVASSAESPLSYDLTMDTPGRYQIRAETEATSGDSTIVDSTSTAFIRTPNVVDQPRPSGVQDGINYNSDGSVTLSLFTSTSAGAEPKEFVYAVGDFSEWEIDSQYFMKREQTSEGTHWWITLDNLDRSSQHDFQYFVDGEIRTFDPFAHKVRSPQDGGISEEVYPGLEPYPDGETEGLVSVIRADQQQSSFSFSDFQPPEREELVIYELLLRDFVGESSFAVLADTLGYLDRLGVNAVELMPVANFGGNNSWGYNPNAHLALDKSYGPPEDFKAFVEEAHSRGIAVIMDVVYNHVTAQSPLVQLYGSNVKNPFLEPEPDEDPTVDRGFCDDFFSELNHGSSFIKRYIDRANEYWIEEFNVDGFRFDLAKCVADDGVTVGTDGYTEAVKSGWKDVSDHVWDTVDADTYMILEFFGSPAVENELGGYRDGDTGSMMTWHNMNRPYSQADMGFLEGGDFSSDFSAAYYENRSGYDQPSFIAYMESHDEQWLMRRKKAFGNSAGSYSTRDLDTALNRQKLVGAFYFTVPGPRMMWQFGELGYGWGPNECLKPSDACSANDPGRTAPKPIRWGYRNPEQNPGRVKLYRTWSSLIELRSQSEAFTSLQTDVSMKVGNGDYGRRIVLEHDSMDAVVVGNMGVTARDVATNFPSTGTWYDYFTGQEVNIESAEQNAAVSMAPGEFHVYTSEPVDFPETGLVPWTVAVPPPEAPTSLETSFNDVGTVVSLSWSASTAGDVTGYQIYRSTAADFDTTGTRIATVGPQTTSYDDSTVTSGAAYYYRVAARDNDGLRSPSTPAVQALQYPETLTIQASRSFGDGQDPSDYRLIALPGEVDRGLAETFDGEAGDAWQAYWDDGSSENYLQQFDGSSTFDLRPGRGFWAISESSWSVSEEVSTVPLRQTTAGQAAVISLRAGWNIISNPLEKDVAWRDVEAANGGSLQPLWRFDGSFSQAGTFASATGGEAFYFHNQSGQSNLRIPYAVDGGGGESSRKAPEELLTVTAHGPDDATSTVQVGRSTEVEDGVGTEDVIAPTTKFAALSLHVRAQDAETNARGRTLARSIRAADDDAGEVYELALQSKSDGPIRLSVENVAGNVGPEVRLANRQTGATHDLRGGRSVTVRPSDETTQWALLAGSQTFVEKEQSRLLPESLTLWPTYPNPFRQQTTIEYTLPKAGAVTVEVYDLLGRRVRVLMDGRQTAGLHRVRWNGRGGGGAPAASGLYIVRVKAAGTTRSRKMTLVR